MKKTSILSILAIGAMTIIAWCGGTNSEPAKIGDNVSVNYIGRTTDSVVFDTNITWEAQKAWLYDTGREYIPLEFTVWSGMMIQWFDEAIPGMKIWETKTVKFGPEKWYWQAYPEAIITTWITVFEEAGIPKAEVIEWAEFNFGWQNAVITKVDGENVTVDFNSKLAGKDLEFDITLVSIWTKTP